MSRPHRLTDFTIAYPVTFGNLPTVLKTDRHDIPDDVFSRFRQPEKTYGIGKSTVIFFHNGPEQNIQVGYGRH